MEKVYIVEQCMEYEGCQLRGIFSNQTEAFKYSGILQKEDSSIDVFVNEETVYGTAEDLAREEDKNALEFEELLKSLGMNNEEV